MLAQKKLHILLNIFQAFSSYCLNSRTAIQIISKVPAEVIICGYDYMLKKLYYLKNTESCWQIWTQRFKQKCRLFSILYFTRSLTFSNMSLFTVYTANTFLLASEAVNHNDEPIRIWTLVKEENTERYCGNIPLFGACALYR